MQLKGATLKDVAREANVSIASASRAINGLENVAEEVRIRVLAAAKKLHYIPHEGARSLAMRKTNTIGVLLPDIYGDFFSEIIRGIDEASRELGLHILVSSTHGNREHAIAMMRNMSGRVDGLLIKSPLLDDPLVGDYLPSNIPVVAISSNYDERYSDIISVDNYNGGFEATKHLINIGCKNIAHISGPDNNIEAKDRLRGFMAAMQEANLKPAYIAMGDFTEEKGIDCAHEIVNKAKVDGIFAANDMMAIGALNVFEAKGLKVPDDIALIGFDDINLTRYMRPPLSTMKVGIAQIGRRAFEHLAQILRGTHADENRNLVIKPQLIIRGSTNHQY